VEYPLLSSEISNIDPDLYIAMEKELRRQQTTIELIASENIVSTAVLAAQGSILTNKYAEGYPSKRYYGGCEFVDIVEELAIERAKKLFGADHANVQAHSGSQANMAAYMALLQHGDTILGMELNSGGHLTHGFHLNFSGIYYKAHTYQVDPETHLLDYESIRKIAIDIKPKLIIAGASAYSRTIDYSQFRKIADEVGAYLLVDMAHIAGLIAAGLHPNPIPYADIVTSTTHKTLRGPRGGLILCKKEFAKAVNKALFPGIQGGPLMHIIAAKAISFKEALHDDFKIYQQQVLSNAQILTKEFLNLGFPIVSGGTDTHLCSIDLRSHNTNGQEVSTLCDSANITVNKNTIPFDTASPIKPSGIRIGSPSISSRGMKEIECIQIVKYITELIKNKSDKKIINNIKNEIIELCEKFPIYQ